MGSESPLHLFTAPRKRQRVRLTTEFKRREWRDPRCFYLILFWDSKESVFTDSLALFRFRCRDDDTRQRWKKYLENLVKDWQMNLKKSILLTPNGRNIAAIERSP